MAGRHGIGPTTLAVLLLPVVLLNILVIHAVDRQSREIRLLRRELARTPVTRSRSALTAASAAAFTSAEFGTSAGAGAGAGAGFGCSWIGVLVVAFCGRKKNAGCTGCCADCCGAG